METFIIGKFRFRQNLACFDYDGTIIKPKGKNNVVSKDIDDWIWLPHILIPCLVVLEANNSL